CGSSTDCFAADRGNPVECPLLERVRVRAHLLQFAPVVGRARRRFQLEEEGSLGAVRSLPELADGLRDATGFGTACLVFFAAATNGDGGSQVERGQESRLS